MSYLNVLFSIVVPTYNRSHLLSRCLESLCNQTLKNFEVLVCDDGSTDNSATVVESFKNALNIKYLWEENWGGPARPRNRGISVAKGEWICFLDSDDWFFPDKLEEINKYIQKFDCIYHDLDSFGIDGKKHRKIKSRQLNGNITKDLLLNGSIPNSSVCIKTKLLKSINGFCEDKKLIAVEDFDCWLRLAEITSKFKYIPQSLGAYYIGENLSISEKQIVRIGTVVNKHINKLTEEDQRLAYKTLFYAQALTYHKMASYKMARNLYKKSITKGLNIRNINIVVRYLLTLLKIIF